MRFICDKCRETVRHGTRAVCEICHGEEEVFASHQTAEAKCSARPTCCAAGDKNRYGVDVAYFRKELGKLSRDLDNYTPQELARYFEALSDVACSAA